MSQPRSDCWPSSRNTSSSPRDRGGLAILACVAKSLCRTRGRLASGPVISHTIRRGGQLRASGRNGTQQGGRRCSSLTALSPLPCHGVDILPYAAAACLSIDVHSRAAAVAVPEWSAHSKLSRCFTSRGSSRCALTKCARDVTDGVYIFSASSYVRSRGASPRLLTSTCSRPAPGAVWLT